MKFLGERDLASLDPPEPVSEPFTIYKVLLQPGLLFLKDIKIAI